MNFFLPSCRFIFLYDMLKPFFQRFIMGIQFNGHALINLCDLFAQVPAARMDDEIMLAT